jgi:hypothetical protein
MYIEAAIGEAMVTATSKSIGDGFSLLGGGGALPKRWHQLGGPATVGVGRPKVLTNNP